MVKVVLWLVVAMAANVAEAHEARWILQTSVLTAHYNPDPDHNNRQELLGLEYTNDNGLLVGGARFVNSFNQKSAYIYTGRRFSLGEGPVFGKLTGGLLHGYRGSHEDKVPFNRFGVAPALIPSLGLQGEVLSSELVFLGAAAIMVNLGIQF